MWNLPTFLSPVQTLHNLVPGVSSFIDNYVKKYEEPEDKFGSYAFVQDLCWCKGRASCFKYISFEKLAL